MQMLTTVHLQIYREDRFRRVGSFIFGDEIVEFRFRQSSVVVVTCCVVAIEGFLSFFIVFLLKILLYIVKFYCSMLLLL